MRDHFGSLEGERASYKFTGEIALTVGEDVVRFTDLSVELRPLAWRVELRGPFGELRKLSGVSPSMGSMLALRADHADDVKGILGLVATPDHKSKLDAAMPPGLPAAWFADDSFALLLLTLDGYVVESVGVVTYEGPLDG